MKKIRHFIIVLLSSFTAGATAIVTLKTKARLKESIPFAGYTHSHLTKKTTEKVTASDPKYFQKGLIKAICGVLVYDMSKLEFPTASHLKCDIHLGMVTILIPSNVNVVLESQSFFGNCAALTGHYLDDSVPQLYIKAHAYIGSLSIRCIDDFSS